MQKPQTKNVLGGLKNKKAASEQGRYKMSLESWTRTLSSRALEATEKDLNFKL